MGADDPIARISDRFARRDRSPLARRYDLVDPANLFLVHGQERAFLRTLVREGAWPLGARRILDVGCGSGHFLRWLGALGAEPEACHGVDISVERLERARQLAPHHHHQLIDGHHLPFPDAHFDLVVQRTVFSSLDTAELRQALAAEMRRVLRPEGLMLWYDVAVPNPWNPDLRPMSPGDLRALFPGMQIRLERMSLLPPLARLVAPWSLAACHLLETLPFLRGHLWGVLRHG